MDLRQVINSTVSWTTAATTTLLAVSDISSHIDTHGGDISAEPTDYNYYYYEDYGDEDYGRCEYGRHGSYFLPVLYSLFFIVGFLGNALVLWLIVFMEKLRTMTDVCLLNLAVADLLLVCSLPFLAHQARDQWPFGDPMCKVVLGAYHIGFYGGIFFITLMSVERYLAIVHAVYALRARTRSIGMALAAVVWVAGVLVAFPDVGFLQVQEAPRSSNETVLFCAPAYGGHHENGTATHNRHYWSIFGLFKMNICGLLIPMAIMVFCYACIVRRLQSIQASTEQAVLSSQTPTQQAIPSNQSSTEEAASSNQSSAERQAIRMVAVVVVVFLCCWVPYNVASFFKALELLHVYTACESSKAIHLALQITEAVAYSHSCLNPVLYVFVEKKFRRHLRKLMNKAPCWLIVKALVAQDRATGAGRSHTTSLDETSTVV